jgi:16S rRNA (cytosine1402-N4)-methyltransferase
MDSERQQDRSAEPTDGSSPSEHIPVLAGTLAEHIHLPTDGIFVDVTAGHGGHSRLFGSQLGPEGTLVGLDVDQHCIQKAQAVLAGLACRVILVRENFSRLDEVLSKQGIGKVDGILADLGFCSAQAADPQKGMSFQVDAPLDMRLDNRLSVTAADVVNQMHEKQLADLIFHYGQERASRRIARFIVNRRIRQKILTTGQLAGVVCEALGQPAFGRRSKIHPATRTFQALRVAVNDELDSLKQLLLVAPKLLKKDGILAIISFHSLEDGLVKEDFRTRKQEGVYEILTKKPLTADGKEMMENPRSRSAKLRIARKL